MLQVSERCFACFNKFVLKSGQCASCGAPPLMVADQADALPLSFLAWTRTRLEDLVEYAKVNSVLIDFPKPSMSEDQYKVFLKEFSSPFQAYANLVKGTAGLEGGMGIRPSGENAPDAKLATLRTLIFNPVRDAVVKAFERFAPLRLEFEMLLPYVTLKDLLAQNHECLLHDLAFRTVYSSGERDRFQSHLDFGHQNFLKTAAESSDSYFKLRALQRYAFFDKVDDLATVILFLHTGEARGEFNGILDGHKYSAGYANPNGVIRPLSDAFGLETVLNLLSWRTFRRLPHYDDNPRPYRSRIDQNSLRHTLNGIKGQHTVTDAYLALAQEENGEAAATAGAADELAKTDADFALSRLMVKRPLDMDTLKSLIVKSPDRKAIGWIVGWADKEVRLPYVEKEKLEDAEIGELAEGVRSALTEIKKHRRPMFSDKQLELIRKQAVEYPLKRASWERSSFPAPMKDGLINLLIFHENDPKVIAQAVSLLTAPAETFWLKSEIQLDMDLFHALTGPDEWGYRVQTFFDSCARLPEGVKTDVLDVEPEFIWRMHDWLMLNKPGNVWNMERFWIYLGKMAFVHRDAEVIEQTFMAWLGRFNLPATMYASDQLEHLTELSRARVKFAPSSRTIGVFLKTADGAKWKDGMEKFLKAQAHERLEGPKALAMKMLLEQEELLAAYRQAAGDQQFINVLMDIVLGHNLNDPGLFAAYFEPVKSMVTADPSPNRLKKLRARGTSASFIENKEIQKMVLDFVNQWPDPEQAEQSRLEKQRADDRAAERAHKNAMQASTDLMIEKLEAAHQENIRGVQAEMQENLAKASARLGAAITMDPDKIAEAQKRFEADINAIQAEGTKKILALTEGLAQAKALMKKIS